MQSISKYVAEFIGTFFLVFTIGSVVIAANPLAPLAIGSVLMVMIFAGGHISGAHYNPAVTLGVFMRGKCSAADILPYMASQVAGAVVAGLAVGFLQSGNMPVAAPETLPSSIQNVILAEVLFTFALVYVVLNVATAAGTANNSFYGLAIGFTVMAGALAVGKISGGVFNPAVAVGLGVMKLANWNQIWVYPAANFGGAIWAAIVFRVVNGADSDDQRT